MLLPSAYKSHATIFALEFMVTTQNVFMSVKTVVILLIMMNRKVTQLSIACLLYLKYRVWTSQKLLSRVMYKMGILSIFYTEGS